MDSKNKKQKILLISFCLLCYLVLSISILVKSNIFSTKKDAATTRLVLRNELMQNKNILNVNGQNIILYRANTPEQRRRGLSIFDNISNQEGMIFVFENLGLPSFWMKDMNFSIDIIWLDEKKKIVTIKENISPDDFPTSYSSDQPALYVLEFNAGFAKQHDLKQGDVLDIDISS